MGLVINKSAMAWVLVLLLFLVTSCSSNSVRLDTDQSTDFSRFKSYAVVSISADTLGANRLVSATSEFIEQNGRLVGDREFVDAVIELNHYEERRPNQSRLSIGLGTGSYGRSGGIGVGGAVNVPLGDDMLPYVIVVMKVLVQKRLVWSASNSAAIDKGTNSATANAQLDALQGLLDVFPITRQGIKSNK
jgi:hypothetical protein